MASSSETPIEPSTQNQQESLVNEEAENQTSTKGKHKPPGKGTTKKAKRRARKKAGKTTEAVSGFDGPTETVVNGSDEDSDGKEGKQFANVDRTVG